MHGLMELKEMLCRELDEIAKKQELSAGDLETAHKLTDTIKNQMHKGDSIIYDSGYSQASAPTVGDYGSSDFLQAVSGKDSAAAWAVMDELMGTLAMVNERVYNRIMRKMSEL